MPISSLVRKLLPCVAPPAAPRSETTLRSETTRRPEAAPLPDAALDVVLAQLPTRELFAAAAVCKDWHRVALANPALWKPHARAAGCKDVAGTPALPDIARKMVIRANVRSGQARSKGDPYGVTSWSPDDSKVLLKSHFREQCPFDYNYKLHEASTDRPIAELPAFVGMCQATWSADSGFVVNVGSRYGKAHIVEAASGQIVASYDTSTGPCWNPEKTVLAIAQDGQVHLFDSRDASLRSLPRTAERIKTMVWDPSGQRLALQQDTQVNVIDMTSGDIRMSTPRVTGHLPLLGRHDNGISWSPDGQYLVLENSSSLQKIVNVDTGDLLRLPVQADRLICCEWTADGQHVALGSAEAVHILPISDAWSVPVEGHTRAMAWNPQGTKLAVVTDSGGSYFFDLPARTWGYTEHPIAAKPASLSWDADGQRFAVAVSSAATGLDEGRWIDAETGVAQSAIGFAKSNEFQSTCAQWNHDRTRLAFVGPGAVVLFCGKSGEQLARLPNDASGTYDVWSPDGTMLLTHSGKQLMVHDDEGQRLTAIPCKPVRRCAWSPDGSKIELILAKSGGSRILDFEPQPPSARMARQARRMP